MRRLRRFVSRREPRRTRVAVNQLVREVEQLMLFHANRFSIQMQVELADTLPPVSGDSLLIEQVLVNLVRNAFEAIHDNKSAEAVVTLRTAMQGVDMVEITVADSGPGFGIGSTEQLFEAFFTTKSSGMGLGLVISRSIVQATRRLAYGIPESIRRRDVSDYFTCTIGGRLIVEATVFIVDDDVDALDSLECLLKSIGLSVEAYQSPSAFLQNYDPSRPGCIVLDVRMPELSGLELQQELVRRGASPPIIVITGHGDVPVCAAAFRAGAFDFIEKPVNPQLLLGRIQRAIEQDAIRRRTLRQSTVISERTARSPLVSER